MKKIKEIGHKVHLFLKGECEWEGCDKAQEWAGFCGEHLTQSFREAGEKREREQFNRKADIIAEGIRRAKEREHGDSSR